MKIDSQLRTRLRKKILHELKSPHDREVLVKSAYKLSEAELHKIQSSLNQLKGAKLLNVVDESILGGLVIVDGSKIIDYSLKGKLNDLVQTLLAS